MISELEVIEYWDGEYNTVTIRKDGKEVELWWTDLYELKKEIDEILTHT